MEIALGQVVWNERNQVLLCRPKMDFKFSDMLREGYLELQRWTAQN